MLLDIIVIVILIAAVIYGYRRGFIIAVFSLVAFILGIAAAIKLSVIVAGYIGKAVNVSDKWLPVISFAVVFIIVVLLVRLGAVFLQKTVEFAMMGWLNRLGGILLYICLYILIFSILIFYADQLKFIKPETKKDSVTYSYVQPLGPKVIDGFGKLIPVFKGMFQDLESFFETVSRKIPPAD